MTRITNVEALSAIVSWMGTYEGATDGDQLDTLVARGATDEELVEKEEIPADIVAGYHLAVKQWAAAVREQTLRQVVAAYMRRNPDADQVAVEKHLRRTWRD